jgi:hypothetical protein
MFFEWRQSSDPVRHRQTNNTRQNTRTRQTDRQTDAHTHAGLVRGGKCDLRKATRAITLRVSTSAAAAKRCPPPTRSAAPPNHPLAKPQLHQTITWLLRRHPTQAPPRETDSSQVHVSELHLRKLESQHSHPITQPSNPLGATRARSVWVGRAVQEKAVILPDAIEGAGTPPGP